MSNPFISEKMQGGTTNVIKGSGDLASGGIRKHGISIPKYVPTTNQSGTPVPVKIGDSYGLPAYFRFAVSISQYDSTASDEESKKLRSYYGDPKYRKTEFQKLVKGPRNAYMNFVLQKVSENFQEKYQLVETFGDSFLAYFYGSRHMVININGILIDDQLSDMKSQFIYIYNTYFRAYHVAKHKILVEFGYGDTTIKGVMLSLGTETGDTINEVQTNFQVQMLVYQFNKPLANLGVYTSETLSDDATDALDSVIVESDTLVPKDSETSKTNEPIVAPSSIEDVTHSEDGATEDDYQSDAVVTEAIEADQAKEDAIKECGGVAAAALV
jgi:hypothetical protein